MTRETATPTNLITAIVNDEDAGKVLKALSDRGMSATKIASTGGLLRRGSAVILVGVEEQRLDEVLEMIRANCRRRHRVDTAQLASLPTSIKQSAPIEEGGAVMMVTDIERYVRV